MVEYSVFSYKNFFYVTDILGEDFLTLVAKHIGDDWRTFFIDLGFETFDLPHFSHKVDSLLETILNGLHSWKKKPLTDKSSKSTSIKEIFDLIIEGLELNGCRTIAEKIQSNFTSSGTFLIHLYFLK